MTSFDSDSFTHLEPFVPRGLLSSRTGAPSVACVESSGAALAADLCGFTGMTREQERSGRAGAERLTEFLDRTLGRFVDGVSERGGDVVAFAGDSVLAIWDDADAVVRATACALELIERHRVGRPAG